VVVVVEAIVPLCVVVLSFSKGFQLFSIYTVILRLSNT